MYDPEFRLFLERQMSAFAGLRETMLDAFGEGDPHCKVVVALGGTMDVLYALNEEYDDCFDTERREEIAAKVRGFIQQAEVYLNELREMLEEGGDGGEPRLGR